MDQDAFEAGTGASLSDVYMILAGVGCVVAFLWTAWALSSLYRGYVKDRVDGDIFGVATVRCFFLLIVLLWLFLP